MSMDYLKTTYRPAIPRDTKRRTSYSQMNHWMRIPPMEKKRVVQVNSANARGGQRPVFNSYKSLHLGRVSSERDATLKAKPVDNVETEYTSRFCVTQKTMKPHGRTKSEIPRGSKGKGRFGGASNIPPPVHLQFYKSGGYDDSHKAFRNLEKIDVVQSFPYYGPPRLRNGHVGGSWRHMKEVLQAGGTRIVFVDGQISNDDRHRSQRVFHGDMIHPIIRRRYNEDHGAMADHQAEAPPRRRTRPLNLTAYRDVQGQNAREKVNWNIMR